MASTPDDLTRAALDGDVATIAATGPVRGTPAEHCFEPGAIIAGRYRVIALLGRGGMGEVYRADDLTLDVPVALKFLPPSAGAARLEQFRNELKLARQVAHKNVCRVYDLGAAGDRPFLTMEYIDGEDLSSLLRRIGRIPHDKAVDIARQLCAGIAAAHERGVVHRDLKPANVMIDGHGNVRITDFGIATAGIDATDIAGTPQYMAPEQFAGQPASARSDIYALGLILFETFTGRRAVESDTIEELRRFHASGTVTTPSSVIHDIDPAVERLVLRCLTRDPNRRPVSALAVAAALPGANPLAAALAAGETPSPELLAAAGETEAMPARRGIAMLAAIGVGLLLLAAGSARLSFVGRTPLDLPPEVLADRARQIIQALGHPVSSGDSAYGFMLADDYLSWLQRQNPSPTRWDALSLGNPSAVLFWYRTSPRELQPLDAFLAPTRDDPPVTDTGMQLVVLDPAGRLREWRTVPPQQDTITNAAAAPRWEPVFTAAGLDPTLFAAVPPQWTPRDFATIRAAWEGPLAPGANQTLRVEAAAYAGKPISLMTIAPWTRPTRMQPPEPTPIDVALDAFGLALLVGLLAAAVVLARNNLRANRADRRGAGRLVLTIGGAGAAAWLIAGHHTGTLLVDLAAFREVAADLAMLGAILWPVYIGVEPYARRIWPDGLLGWSRLLAGHFRDPRFGRDLLFGLAGGVAAAVVQLGQVAIIPALGAPAPYSSLGTFMEQLGGRSINIAAPLLFAINATETALMCAMLVVVTRLMLKRAWLSTVIVAFVLMMVSARGLFSTNPYLVLPFAIAEGLVLTFVLLRFGVLPFAIAVFTLSSMTQTPFTDGFPAWSATPGHITLAVLVGLTLFGFYAARAGQPLFGTTVKDGA